MATFPAAPLLLALEALAATSKGLPAPARFASALLPRAQVWGGGSGGGGAGGGLLPALAHFASALLPRAQVCAMGGGSLLGPSARPGTLCITTAA